MTSVGVTGHRDQSRLADKRAAVDAALERIVETFGAPGLTVVSALAEGADRLVAERAMDCYQARLVAPLPLETEDYMQDFATQDSRQAFLQLLGRAAEVIHLPPQASRTASYLAAGRATLSRCDVLIAIWDGEPPKGEGGTGQIVAEARALGKPLAWIQVSRRDAAAPTGGAGVVHTHYERFPQPGTDKAGER